MTATERLQVKIAIRRKLQPIVYGSPTATGVWYDMGCLGATDLDTGTDKVNPPKKILLSITIQFAGLNWKREKYREKMNHGDIGLE